MPATAKAIISDSFNQPLDRLHQWDANRKVRVVGAHIQQGATVYFHFSNRRMQNAYVVLAEQSTVDDIVGYIADIPNQILMMPDTIYLYVYESVGEGDERLTTDLIQIPVIPRQKPDDYVFEQTSTVLVATGLKYEQGIMYLMAGEQVIGEGVPVQADSARVYTASLSSQAVLASRVVVGSTVEGVE